MVDLKKEIELFSSQVVANWKDKEFIPGKSLVHFSGPSFDENEAKAMLEVISNGWWIAGEKTREFEGKFAPLLGKKYGVFVNSGTSAVMLAAYAVKVINKYKKLNVVTCASCFPSTINPWIQFDNNIGMVDCTLDGNYNINLEFVEGLIEREEDIDVLTFAHVLGNPPNMDKVMEIVKKYNLTLVEDVCDGLGSKWKGKLLGSFGRFSTCSFFPAHMMTTFEGGFVACDTEEDYKLLKSLSNWGRQCDCSGKEQSTSKFGKCGRRFSDWLGIGKNVDHRYVFSNLGMNLKSTEIQAAVGLEQIKKLDKFAEIRKYNYNRLTECFSNYKDHFELPQSLPDADVNWFTYPIRVISKSFERDEFIKYLESNMIQTRLLFTGNYVRHPAIQNWHRELTGETFESKLKNADIVLSEVMMLGVSQVITKDMMDYVCTTIDKFMEQYK